MNQQTYAQFLLSSRSIADLKYMRDYPLQFSSGTCSLWNITEAQRKSAVLTAIAILENQK